MPQLGDMGLAPVALASQVVLCDGRAEKQLPLTLNSGKIRFSHRQPQN